jgi:hypothetical protein
VSSSVYFAFSTSKSLFIVPHHLLSKIAIMLPSPVLSPHLHFKPPCSLYSPSSFPHSISLPVSSTVYSMSPTTSKCVFRVPGLLLAKSPLTALYRGLPVTFPSRHHVHCVPRLRLSFLLASLSHPQSTPWHRINFKMYLAVASFLLSKVKPQSRFRPRYFPDSSTSSHHVHRLPHPLVRQKHQPQLQCLRFPSLNATFIFRP